MQRKVGRATHMENNAFESAETYWYLATSFIAKTLGSTGFVGSEGLVSAMREEREKLVEDQERVRGM